MENRFGIKDFFLFVLIIALIVVQFLQMKQRDLQQARVEVINSNIESQSAQIANLMRTINAMSLSPQSTSMTPATTSPTTQAAFADPFEHIRQAQKMPGYAKGDWLVDNLGSKVARLTPLGSSNDFYGAVVRAKIQEGCAYRDPFTLELVPLLASGWQVSPDGLTIHIQLRRGLTFSDGQPLTADDILWTFNWIMNPKVDAPRERAYYDKVAKVEKTNDLEVVWTFKEPYYESLALATGLTVLPKHFYEKYTPEQFNQMPGLVMGSGPYKLATPTDWTPGQRVEVVRNDFYWGEPGPFNRLVWYEVQQDSVNMTMFQNGEVDHFGAQPEQYRQLLKDQKILDRTQHFEVDSPISGYSYIGWNQQKGGKPTLWQDKRIRQAMTMLTDRQAICDQIFLGYASVANGPFSPMSKQNNPSVQPWPYDPERAKALLKQAGFATNAQGLIIDPTGQPFRFKLTYPSGNETYERVVLLLKDSFAKAGVVMEPDPVDWPILTKKLNERDFDAITLAWTGSVESDIYQEFHSSQIKDQGDDFCSYINPELDKVIEQARATVDPEKRMPLWQKCHEILNDDQPYTFLMRRKGLAFYDKRIKNLKLSKLGLNVVSDDNIPYPWFVPTGEQKWVK